MSHLVLDEIYSVQWNGVTVHVKSSFGTALKLWGKSPWANFSTYAKLIVVASLVFGDQQLMELFHQYRERLPRTANQVFRGWDSPSDPSSPAPWRR